jgi:tRNA dimethylallyltransferase
MIIHADKAGQSLALTLEPDRPVLIAGPTASGKSALALDIVRQQGGVIINADASQVYRCWRVLTARPSPEEERQAPHLLYGHVAAKADYSTGHWLREVRPLLKGPERPVIVGGTGLYFMALTQGLADIPPTPVEVRKAGDALDLDTLRQALDKPTANRIDLANRARVQRAWEVLTATGTGLAAWQEDTGPPALPAGSADAIVFDAPKDWLNDRIARRFDLMMTGGALDEVRAVLPDYDPALPAHRAIGAPDLIAALRGEIDMDTARTQAIIATRQFAKRQRTWFRSKMRDWYRFTPPDVD